MSVSGVCLCEVCVVCVCLRVLSVCEVCVLCVYGVCVSVCGVCLCVVCGVCCVSACTLLHTEYGQSM